MHDDEQVLTANMIPDRDLRRLKRRCFEIDVDRQFGYVNCQLEPGGSFTGFTFNDEGDPVHVVVRGKLAEVGGPEIPDENPDGDIIVEHNDFPKHYCQSVEPRWGQAYGSDEYPSLWEGSHPPDFDTTRYGLPPHIACSFHSGRTLDEAMEFAEETLASFNDVYTWTDEGSTDV